MTFENKSAAQDAGGTNHIAGTGIKNTPDIPIIYNDGEKVKAAEHYAQQGLAVFPCVPGGKEPATRNGFKSATTKVEQVRKWKPTANIGVVPHRSRLAVVDIDVKNGQNGPEQLAALEAQNGKLPVTLTVRTPSGGEHRYFSCDVPLSNTKLADHVDIRCASGYVLLPPSVVDGKAYEWVDPEAKIAHLPQWVIDEQDSRNTNTGGLADIELPGEIKPVGTEELQAQSGVSIPDKALALVATGDDPGNPGRYSSRSEAVFACTNMLVRAGVPNELIVGALIDKRNPISAHILEKGGRDPVDYAIRQVKRAVAEEDAIPVWPGGTTKEDVPRSNYRNAKAALDNFGLVCSYDAFKDRCSVAGDIPGNRQGHLDDKVLSCVRDAIIRKFEFEPAKGTMSDVLVQRCMENAFDPVLDYFNRLKWDGKNRVDRWTTNYLGCEDTELNRAIGRCFLVAIVKRARHPGCKFDTILVLEGKQGSGKSTALEILAGEDYFNDSDVLTLKDGDQAQKMQGFLIHEIADLQNFRKIDVDKLKAFASRRIDRGRQAYGQFLSEVPRRSVFAGTTNDQTYLLDPTGNRRFWPLPTGKVDLKGLRHDRDQLFAEAAKLEAEGASIQLPPELWEEAAKVQESRREEDPWLDRLRQFAGRQYKDGNGVLWEFATTGSLFDHLEVPNERRSTKTGRRLKTVMTDLGWHKPTGAFRVEGEQARGYRREAKPEPGSSAF